MREPATPTPPAAPAPAILHRAARLEDSVHRWRARFGRARGLETTIIPFAGYGAPGWVRILAREVLTRRSRTERHSGRYANVRGWRSFTSIPIDDVEVIVAIGGVEHSVRPGRGGVIDVRLDCALEPGWHEASLRTARTPAVRSPVYIVDPATRFGLVSDIDDTVMVTALPRPLLAAWNTFVVNEHARRPVPGMAVLYERIVRAHPGAPVIYLSTGAWNVAPTLTRFLERNLYPRGSLLLTDWGPTHDRWFRSGRQHKESSLRRLASEFPDVRWLLVGDDGQHDEEIYGDFAAEHGANVAAVAIRQLSASEAVLAGGRSKTGEHAAATGVPWMYSPDGAGLAEQLEL
jgi:phosphatidate phosphatase APP1